MSIGLIPSSPSPGIPALVTLSLRDQKRFERLTGRVDALAILYQTLSLDEQKDEVDLGIYLSQIASAVMASHALEGIRLDMKVDTIRCRSMLPCRRDWS